MDNHNDRQPGYIESILIAGNHYGAESAVKWNDLLKAVGGSERRAYQKMVEAERLAGAPILSGQKGVYLPDKDPVKGRGEIRRYLSHNAKIATALFRINKAFADRMQIDGQQRIDGQGAE